MLKLSTARKLNVITMLLYFAFYVHISIVNGKLMYIFLFASLGLSVICYASSYNKNNHVTAEQFGWILILVLSLVRNWGLARKSYLWPIAFAALIMMLLALSVNSGWHDTFIKLSIIISVLYIAALFFFLVMPSMYSVMRDFWGTWPNGTEYGEYGYRAGLADNHSANGTYCVLAFMICSSILLTDTSTKKQKRYYLIIAVLAAVAVFLTTKRAHLVFGFAALLFVYYIFSKKRLGTKTFVLLSIIIGGLVIYFLTPGLDFLSEADGGDVTSGRLEYWEFGLGLFAEHPVFGIGWLGFRYNSAPLISVSAAEGYQEMEYVDAHNVYVQMLSETGIVGTVIILTVFFSFLHMTVRLYTRNKHYLTDSQTRALAISFCLQIFCLIYGATGNFLYDRTCFLYIFGCALFCSVLNDVRKSKRSNNMSLGVRLQPQGDTVK